LLGSDVVAFAVDDSKRGANIKTAETIELFVACESNYPLLSLKWDNGDIEKAAETASAFLEGKQPLRSFDDAFPGDVGWSRHSPML
jgi:hypothetical protein